MQRKLLLGPTPVRNKNSQQDEINGTFLNIVTVIYHKCTASI